MTKQKVITAMRRERGWAAKMSGNEIKLVKRFGVKVPRFITVILVREDSQYFLKHPDYEAVNTVAHWASRQPNRRFTLSQAQLKSIVSSLKHAGIWNEIKNRQFLEVNDSNKKSNKRKVRENLSALLSTWRPERAFPSCAWRS